MLIYVCFFLIFTRPSVLSAKNANMMEQRQQTHSNNMYFIIIIQQ